MSNNSIIAPSATIGIIGGGQLGQMAAQAAARLGYRVHIFTPEKNSPASFVSYRTTVADYTDKQALEDFAKNVDAITFEFENIPAQSVEYMAAITPVRPNFKVLEVSQNRLREKQFLNDVANVPTATYAPIFSLQDLKEQVVKFGGKAILKTTEMGYDGKGQWRIDASSNLEAIYQQAANAELILEAFVSFQCEISAIVARNIAGDVAVFPTAENQHKNGILDISTVPAKVDLAIQKQAQERAIRVAEALEVIGLLTVEFFVTESGELLANEIAPRPHNSGHYTMDACVTDQFEQFIRAVCGLPLGSVELHSSVEMHNLIGDDINMWQDFAKNPNAKLHLYGKREARKGRKMGHVNIVSSK